MGIYNLLQRKPLNFPADKDKEWHLPDYWHETHLFICWMSLLVILMQLTGSNAEELAKLHREHKKTTIFVTHDQVEAMTLGERICVLNKGKIEQIGDPKTLYENPKNLFVACFFAPSPFYLSWFDRMLSNFWKAQIYWFGNLEFELPDPFKESRQT